MSTVYQYCNKCQTNKPFRFTLPQGQMETLICTTCGHTHKVMATPRQTCRSPKNNSMLLTEQSAVLIQMEQPQSLPAQQLRPWLTSTQQSTPQAPASREPRQLTQRSQEVQQPRLASRRLTRETQPFQQLTLVTHRQIKARLKAMKVVQILQQASLTNLKQLPLTQEQKARGLKQLQEWLTRERQYLTPEQYRREVMQEPQRPIPQVQMEQLSSSENQGTETSPEPVSEEQIPPVVDPNAGAGTQQTPESISPDQQGGTQDQSTSPDPNVQVSEDQPSGSDSQTTGSQEETSSQADNSSSGSDQLPPVVDPDNPSVVAGEPLPSSVTEAPATVDPSTGLTPDLSDHPVDSGTLPDPTVVQPPPADCPVEEHGSWFAKEKQRILDFLHSEEDRVNSSTEPE
jgi:hypothetical protein